MKRQQPHTLSSENADWYRGWQAASEHFAEQLEAALPAHDLAQRQIGAAEEREARKKPCYVLGRTTIERVANEGTLDTEEVSFVAADELFHNNPYKSRIVSCECGQALLEWWPNCHMCGKPNAAIRDRGKKGTMERVSDFRIDTIEIGEAKFYSLPLRTRELFGAYATSLKARYGFLKFELPIYRWKEIEESLGRKWGELPDEGATP